MLLLKTIEELMIMVNDWKSIKSNKMEIGEEIEKNVARCKKSGDKSVKSCIIFGTLLFNAHLI